MDQVCFEMRFTTLITPEMRSFPKSRFLIMGGSDAVAGVLMLLGGVRTSGSYQALFANMVIPMTMVLSMIILKTKFRCLQYDLMFWEAAVLGSSSFIFCIFREQSGRSVIHSGGCGADCSSLDFGQRQEWRKLARFQHRLPSQHGRFSQLSPVQLLGAQLPFS